MAEKNDYEGEIPRLELSPVWSILNLKEEDGLKNQLIEWYKNWARIILRVFLLMKPMGGCRRACGSRT